MLTLVSDVDDLFAMRHVKESSLAFAIRLFSQNAYHIGQM